MRNTAVVSSSPDTIAWIAAEARFGSRAMVMPVTPLPANASPGSRNNPSTKAARGRGRMQCIDVGPRSGRGDAVVMHGANLYRERKKYRPAEQLFITIKQKVNRGAVGERLLTP